ncbi:MAG: hypothetical protein VKK42_23000 [Lyngbya sp.]|nr:hypothetical protein [Lyngbya sp.]
MDFQFRRVVTLLTLATLVTSLTGCAGSRQVQCRKLMELVDQGNLAIAVPNNLDNSATTLRLAQELNIVADRMQKLYLTNGRLKRIRSGFTEVFREFAMVLNEMGQVLEAGEKTPITVEGRAELVKAIEQVNEISQRTTPISEKADTLMAQMTKHCPSESLKPEQPDSSQ